jgi:hypothetical protein
MISFDVMKEERLYHVLIPNGAPFQEAKDVLNEVLVVLEAQEKADKEKAEQATTIETPEIVA